MKINAPLFVFLLSLFGVNASSFAQPGPDWPRCDLQYLGSFRQFTDSIDFRGKCHTKIDFENKSCAWEIAEGYYNNVPVENAQLLCLVYFEGKLDAPDLQLIDLFDDAKTRKKYLDKIQLIFIYDPKTGYSEAFQEKREIEKILLQNIRDGFEKKTE